MPRQFDPLASPQHHHACPLLPRQQPILREIRQAGVTDVVSSLHHIACGDAWPEAEIRRRIREIEWDAGRECATGLRWGMVESLPIHEDIKTRSGNYRDYIAIYQENVRRLGAQGVGAICYNFMPVLDWARTDLYITQADGSTISGCRCSQARKIATAICSGCKRPTFTPAPGCRALSGSFANSASE